MTKEMRYIYEIYRCGGFSKAAEKLGLTQSTLSMAIKREETALGVTLFDRGCTPPALTQAGKIYLEKTRQIMQLEQQLYTELKSLSVSRPGVLRIGGTNYLITYFISCVAALFAQKYPGIHVELFEDKSQKNLDLLEKGEIDLMFYSGKTDEELFCTLPAFSDTILLAVPHRFVSAQAMAYAFSKEEILQHLHVRSGRPAASLELFGEVPFILSHPESNMRRLSTALLEQAGITPPVALEVDQVITSYYMCCRGIGAAFVSSAVVAAQPSADVLFFRVGSPLAVRPFDLILNRHREKSAAVEAFIRILREYYPDEMTER